MSESGKTVAISPFRKLVIDFMHLGNTLPGVTLDRRMNLAPLVRARYDCRVRPKWTSLMIKAYSIVAARRPVLRRSYMTFPWARFYEHSRSIASVNVARRVGDEDIVLQALIKSPESRSLIEIDDILRHHMETPVAELDCYVRARRLSLVPSPFRRFIMWAALNVIGRQRCQNFGTFGITSVAEQGAGVLNVPLMGTSLLHYGLMDDEGSLDVRLAFDHRVLDALPAAQALAELEDVLLGEILEEVEALPLGALRPVVLPPALAELEPIAVAAIA